MRKNIFALIIATALFTSCVSQPESVVLTAAGEVVSTAADLSVTESTIIIESIIEPTFEIITGPYETFIIPDMSGAIIELSDDHSIHDTMALIIDGKEYTLYLNKNEKIHGDYSITNVKTYHFAVLTNNARTVPPTLVREGDTFLGWKAVEIKCDYYCFDDGRMYFSYPPAFVNFEGELKTNANLLYGWDITRDFVVRINLSDDAFNSLPENFNVSYIQRLYSENIYEIDKMLDNKYGNYECEITISNVKLRLVNDFQENYLVIDNLTVLEVIEYYDLEKMMHDQFN